MYHPWSTRSHVMQQTALLRGLLAKGYHITAVFPFPTNIVDVGYKEIAVKNAFSKILKVMTESMMNRDTRGVWTFLSLLPRLVEVMNSVLQDNVDTQHKVIEDLSIRNKSVDAMIMTNHVSFLANSLYDHYKCPIISVSPPGWTRLMKHVGNPMNPAVHPDSLMPFIEPLAFSERLVNTFFYAVMDYDILGWTWISIFADSALFDIQGFSKLPQKTSLLLLCSNFVTHSPRVLTANTVEVGGIHCREGETLPDDLLRFLDAHPEGVVYVSFGSSIKPSQMPPERKQVFMNTFANLNHFVIWKWDEDNIPNLPPNVILRKWLPQQDLLAHPNLRVFVTHGGLLSVQEALYHQTPLVGIPLGNDQKANILRAEKNGFAVSLDWNSIDQDKFSAAINKAMNDDDLKENMKRMHELFVDARDPPLDRAVWWVEYVLRHKGAEFLKPHSVDLPWYQYHLLDVIAFILIILSLFIFLIIKCLMFCCKFACPRKLKTD